VRELSPSISGASADAIALFISMIIFSCSYIAILAFIGVIALHRCICTMYDSLLFFHFDRSAAVRSCFVSTILCNMFALILIMTVAVTLRGNEPTVIFACKMISLSTLLSLALSYPFWTRFLKLKEDSHVLTEPLTIYISPVDMIVNGIRTTAKQRCKNKHLSI
jgi:hypothetical protein